MPQNTPNLKGLRRAGAGKPAGTRKVIPTGQGVDNASHGGPPVLDSRLAKQTIGGKSTVNSTPAPEGQ